MDGEVDISSESIIDGEGAEKDKEENRRSQFVNGYDQNSALTEHHSSLLATNREEYGKENNVKDVVINIGNTQKDGLQEHVMLKEESQTEEDTKCKGEAEVTTIASESMNQSQHIQEKQPDIFLDGDNSSKPDQEEINSMVPEGNGALLSSSSVLSKSEKGNTSVDRKSTVTQNQKSRMSHNLNSLPKGIPEAATRNSMGANSKCKKNAGEECQIESAARLAASNSSLRRTGNRGSGNRGSASARTKYTVPQPFALATDKRASTVVRPIDGEIAGATDRHTIENNITSSSVVKKPQLVVKTASTPLCSKSLHSESMKLQEQNEKPSTQVNSNHDDEDNSSVASSTATPTKGTKERPKGSASVPSFRCHERAEKRKAFFSKLEEKFHVKELEKSELQAKKKEKQEAEIKQLRKTMTFKATPLPDFYHESAPPKIELKKIPPTRAKSPKLGRRNSCVGVESEGDCGQSITSSCSSLNKNKSNGPLQDLIEDENTEKGFGKDNSCAKKTMRKSLTKVPSAKQLVKSKLDEMPSSKNQQALNGLETKSAIGLTGNGNLTTSSVSNTSMNACDDERENLQGSQAVKEKDNTESLNEYTEIPEGMVSHNPLRDCAEGILNVNESEVNREKDSLEPLDGHYEIVNINKQRESDKNGMNLQESEVVKGKDSDETLKGHIEITEVNINRDERGESGFLVATVKVPENGNGKLANNVQVSDTSKSKRNGSKVRLGSKVHKKEQVQDNGAGVNGTKSKSVRSNQEGSVRGSLETNGKGIQNLGRDQLKVMAHSITSSKREGIKSASLKRSGKGSNGMDQVMGDVAVQS